MRALSRDLRPFVALLAALLALVGMAGRGGFAVGVPTDTLSLTVALGATLCHSDGSAESQAPADHAPADAGICDHCPMCSVVQAVLAPPASGSAEPSRWQPAPPPVARVGGAVQRAARDTGRQPRAPPALS